MADPIHDDDVHNAPDAIHDDDVHNSPSVNIPMSDVPVFEQNAAKSVNLVPGNDPDAVAHTGMTDPNRIAVDNPKLFDKTILAHELTHIIQNRADSTESNYANPTAGAYDFGGTKGLAKTKSISTLNDEQQADIPKTYMDNITMFKTQLENKNAGKVVGGLKVPSVQDTLRQADNVNKAYARPMQQLEAMANPSKDTIKTEPQPPGPPPAELTGMIKPLPQIGGKTIYVTGTDPHSKALNKARKALGGG